MNKRIISIVIILLIFLILIFGFSITGKNVDNKSEINTVGREIVIVMFYGKGCPHCGKLINFLDDLKNEYPNLVVEEYETYFNNEDRKLFEGLSEVYGSEIRGVPTTFIDSKIIVGYSSSIGNQIKQEVERCNEEECINPLEKIENGDTTQIIGDSSPLEDPEQTKFKNTLTIPAVIFAAVVDAINPCAFAVLIILLTTILSASDKKKALFAGLAFTFSIFISYFLMGLGLYSAVQATGFTHSFFIIVAILAIFIGLFNLKDYFWYGKWFVMEVPISWRPRMKILLKGVTSVPGAFFIGFVVSLFLLPCTSGPYIVILGLLAKATTRTYAIVLLFFYNLIFILPMLIITLGIYFGVTTTERAEAWRQRKLKTLHLIAGLIILLLGMGMLFSIYVGWI